MEPRNEDPDATMRKMRDLLETYNKESKLVQEEEIIINFCNNSPLALAH